MNQILDTIVKIVKIYAKLKFDEGFFGESGGVAAAKEVDKGFDLGFDFREG